MALSSVILVGVMIRWRWFRHDNKLMQKILFLCSVIHQDFNEEPGNPLYLEETFSVEYIGSDKVGGFSCSSSMRNRQKVTSAAKAET
jgi:hypothetical protein